MQPGYDPKLGKVQEKPQVDIGSRKVGPGLNPDGIRHKRIAIFQPVDPIGHIVQRDCVTRAQGNRRFRQSKSGPVARHSRFGQPSFCHGPRFCIGQLQGNIGL